MTRVADILIDSLLNQGTDIGFGVPGESYLAILDAFYDRAEDFQFITCRHEGGAGFMAEAYGKLTGLPGLCFVTRGPGAANAAIAIHTAHQNSTPMIVFVGQIRSGDRDREAFQELEYRSVFGHITKWVTELDNPDRAGEIVRRAYNVALSGRPGPVVVALPENVLRMDCTRSAAPRVNVPIGRADPVALEAAGSLFQNAQKPLVVVGGGAWTAHERLRLKDFAERTTIPVMTAFRCQDLLDNRLPNYIGDAGVGMPLGSKAALQEADLILALNVRFGEMLTDAWSLFESRSEMPRLIHIHRDPAEVNKIYHADVALVGSPADILDSIEAHPLTENWAAGYRAAFLGLRQTDEGNAVSMAALCRVLNAGLPRDTILTNGAGNFAVWPSRHIDLGADRRLIAPQSGAMGAGVPAAIAAKMIRPERHVLCFAGDGDVQMTGNELSTADQFDARPNILILNNGSYGTIESHQKRAFPGRRSGTELTNPDFESWARSFGFDYRLIETADCIKPVAYDICVQQGLVVEIVNY